MNAAFCPCLPCWSKSQLPELEQKKDNEFSGFTNLVNDVSILIFSFLGRDLGQAYLTCKKWSILIACQLPHDGQCLYARRHVVAMDVSGSMGLLSEADSELNKAVNIAAALATKLVPVIKRIGIFAGRFAETCELKHFKTLESVQKYISAPTTTLGARTNFGLFLNACLEKFKELEMQNKYARELVIHLVSDLEMSKEHFAAFLDKQVLKTFPGKISLICYPTKVDIKVTQLKDDLLKDYRKIKDEKVEKESEEKREAPKRKHSITLKIPFYRDVAHVGFISKESLDNLKKPKQGSGK